MIKGGLHERYVGISEILRAYDTINLDEMSAVRLMNRIDTKYITTLSKLEHLLDKLKIDYLVQDIETIQLAPYYTLYFDTIDSHMYNEHQRGRKTRQKIRMRRYEASNSSFLEIKNKNNKSRTSKRRIEATDWEDEHSYKFIQKHANYEYNALLPQLENQFRRITLVNRGKTERLTIDVKKVILFLHIGNLNIVRFLMLQGR